MAHKMSKKTCQKLHARKRFNERFGVFLKKNDYNIIVNNIEKEKYDFLENQSWRISVWQGMVQGHETIIIYDSKRKSIVTFLTKKMYYEGVRD